jgi:hypothetical protein
VEDQAVGWRKGLLDESTLWSTKCQERYVLTGPCLFPS